MSESTLQAFLGRYPQWASKPGPLSEVILSSRVRLARNLEAVPFPTMGTPDQMKGVAQRIQQACQFVPRLKESDFLPVADLEPHELDFLLERRLISRDLAMGKRHSAVVVELGEELSLMVNEEDHLRLQGVVSGFRLGEALDLVSEVDDELEGHVGFAFSESFGYLTACPTNVGTGMRASVLAHLPALSITGEARKVIQGAAALGLAVRGFYGEGTEIMGNFVQISNQTTLGIEENEIVVSLSEKVQKIIDAEAAAREKMWTTAKVQLEDKVYRAQALLQSARSLKSKEVLSLTSAVRFGLALELPDLCSAEVLNEILVFSQSGHVRQWAGRELNREEKREFRATIVRARLHEAGWANGSGSKGWAQGN